MEYFLKLSFKDAGFFEKATNNQKPSISVHQISNMLHVLMGERPSPTYRDTLIKPISDIFNIANLAYIKIDTTRFLNKSSGKMCYMNEFIQTNKFAYDSYRDKKRSFIYWENLECYLTTDLFIEMINLFNNILGYDVKSKPAMYIIKEIITYYSSSKLVIDINNEIKNNSKIKFANFIKQYNDNSDFTIFCKKLVKNNKTPIANLLIGIVNQSAITIGQNPKTTLTNIRGIDNITKISGSIIIPLTSEYVDKIKNSKGCATLLDGGFVWIEDLINEDEMIENDLDSYININKLEEYENKN